MHRNLFLLIWKSIFHSLDVLRKQQTKLACFVNINRKQSWKIYEKRIGKWKILSWWKINERTARFKFNVQTCWEENWFLMLIYVDQELGKEFKLPRIFQTQELLWCNWAFLFILITKEFSNSTTSCREFSLITNQVNNSKFPRQPATLQASNRSGAVEVGWLWNALRHNYEQIK